MTFQPGRVSSAQEACREPSSRASTTKLRPRSRRRTSANAFKLMACCPSEARRSSSALKFEKKSISGEKLWRGRESAHPSSALNLPARLDPEQLRGVAADDRVSLRARQRFYIFDEVDWLVVAHVVRVIGADHDMISTP